MRVTEAVKDSPSVSAGKKQLRDVRDRILREGHVIAHGWQNAEAGREDVDDAEAKDEAWRGLPYHGEDPDAEIRAAASARCRKDAQRQAENKGDHHGKAGEFQRQRETLENDLKNRLAIGDRETEISCDDSGKPAAILDEPTLVDTEIGR